MKIKLLNLLIFVQIIFIAKESISNAATTSSSATPDVLSYNQRMKAAKLFDKKSLRSAIDIYNFCFRPTKSTNLKSLKEKVKQKINNNINFIKKNYYSQKIIKYAYEINPNVPESQYLRRLIEINGVYLTGGTFCRCCVPVDILKKEKLYIATGSEKLTNELSKLDYDKFLEFIQTKTSEFENKLNRIS